LGGDPEDPSVFEKIFSEVRSKHKHGARILSDPKPASGPPFLERLSFSQILVDVPKQNPCFDSKPVL
jgi:hypothetical protein